jgi:hypothetical protein
MHRTESFGSLEIREATDALLCPRVLAVKAS